MQRRFKACLIPILAALLLIAGCGKQQAPQAPSVESDHRPVVRIGVVPAVTVAGTLRQYQPVVDYLNRRLDIDAALVPQQDYAAVLKKLHTGEIDAGIMGSYICYRAIEEIGAVPLARPQHNGVSSYESVIFVRKDSGIRDILGLKGKSFVYVDRNTSAGYVYPRALVKKAGVDPDALFGEMMFAGRHDAAILMVLDRRADGGAAKDDVYFRLSKTYPRIKSELKILRVSAARFPDRTLAVRAGFDAALAQRIKHALLDMDRDPAGRDALRAAGFDKYIATDVRDFANLKSMLR